MIERKMTKKDKERIERMIDRRKKHKVGLEELAAEMHLNHATLSRWETGFYAPQIWKWSAYAISLNRCIDRRKKQKRPA